MKDDFRNIIFDFGGVIIRIDYQRIPAAFKAFGLQDFEKLYSKAYQSSLFDDFEKGLLSAPQFREGIREISGMPLTDDQIDNAWNAILIDIPQKNVETLQRLKQTHRLFLLSNTNELHEKGFTDIMRRDYGKNLLPELFEKVYLSHHLHMRKPDVKIFERVLLENNLDPAETLFVDDSPQHLEGAKLAAMQTMICPPGKMVADLFS